MAKNPGIRNLLHQLHRYRQLYLTCIPKFAMITNDGQSWQSTQLNLPVGAYHRPGDQRGQPGRKGGATTKT